MQIINIEEYDDEVVLHFGGERKKINAYSLASSLVSIADAVKAANDVLNPGYDVEVLVEAFGEGSFRAKITTVFKGDRKSTRLNSSHVRISYAVFCLKKKKKENK